MSQRANQVAEELRKIVSMIFVEDMSGDPRIGFVTITRIEVTDDLRFARIYYSVLGDEEKQRSTEEALDENMGFIRHLAVERLNMKFAPDIRFEKDKSIEHSFRIDDILRRIHGEDKD
jgi:ribosome-binding factor A